MAIGEYTLAKQIDNHGYYAKVGLELTKRSEAGLVVEFTPSEGVRWQSAILFGATYAWEHYLRTTGASIGAKARITEVHWQMSDTTNVAMAFAAAHAFWQALEFVPESIPSFVLESKSFCFPN